MRAAVYRAPKQPFEVCEVPDPTPGESEVVIAVRRCGICSSDLHFTDGHSDFGFPVNSVLGHEVAGEVVAIGKEVSRVRIGDRVAAMIMAGCNNCIDCREGRPSACKSSKILTGGYAEYCLSGENGLITLPECLSDADGALIEPLAVALRVVLRAGVRVGSNVLVLGAGPIGLGAVFWSRHFGAKRVVVYELDQMRRDLAMLMGADGFLLPDGRPVEEQTQEALGERTDVIIECVGKPGMLDTAIRCVSPGGSIGVAGWCLVPDSFIPSTAGLKEANLVFSSVYNIYEFLHVARTLDRGLLMPRSMIAETISLNAVPKIIDELRTDSSRVKVHVDPSLDRAVGMSKLSGICYAESST